MPEAAATKTSSAAEVTIKAVLLNAVEGCPSDVVRFELVLDTHSAALDAIDLAAAARLETSLGADVSTGFQWSGAAESSHHREGALRVVAPALEGATWIRLTLRSIAGVDRSFEWDASSLVWTRP